MQHYFRFEEAAKRIAALTASDVSSDTSDAPITGRSDHQSVSLFGVRKVSETVPNDIVHGHDT